MLRIRQGEMEALKEDDLLFFVKYNFSFINLITNTLKQKCHILNKCLFKQILQHFLMLFSARV